MRHNLQENVNGTQGCARAMREAWLSRDRDRTNREIRWVLSQPTLPFNDPESDRQDILKAIAVLMRDETGVFGAGEADARVETWMEVLDDLTTSPGGLC